jgi:microcin C transport system ATP-binding protein
LRVVRALSNELIVMKDGIVVERGMTQDVFENPTTAYTRSLISAAMDVAVAR